MRLVLIALILNFSTAVGAEEIRGSEAEQIELCPKVGDGMIRRRFEVA